MAFNLIGRLKFGCETKNGANGATIEARYAMKPRYGNSVSNVPGLNALAGVRYYFTERIACSVKTNTIGQRSN